MDRSPSSRQLARTERISNSPYKRPNQQLQQLTKTTPKSPIASFPSLRSIYSFVTAPFSKQPLLPQTSQDLQIDEDQNSQSGSEDGWNGSPPPGMEKEDVTSLAAAGRGKECDIESQEEVQPEYQDRQISNRGLTASSSLEHRPTEAQYSTPLHQSSSLAGVASSSRNVPSTFTPEPSYGTKRPINSAVNYNVSSRKPLPSFLPQAVTGQSAASVALTAFVEAKKGGIMTPHDLRVMRTLMEDMEAEQPGTSTQRTTGWSAGMPVDSPRQVKSIRESHAPASPSTPNRLVDSIRGSPAPLFSVGSSGGRSELGVNSGESPASRRIRYLGPGMSPKRMLNKSRSMDKPQFTSDVAEESEPKRQKRETGPESPTQISSAPQALSPAQSSAAPTPTPVKSRLLEKTKNASTPAKPSPLSRSAESPTPSSPRDQQSIDNGKRRAADIVKELMEKEIGPIETLSKRDYMVINPYDLPSPAVSSRSDAASSSLSRSISRNATPKKSILRSSLRGSTSTPLSGAAAKLEAYKPGRKLTTLELLDGKRPWTDNVDQTMRSQSPTPEREGDVEEVEELMEESPAPSRQKSPAPPVAAEKSPQPDTSRPLPKMPAPFMAPSFKAPEISSPARPVPSFSASPAKSTAPAAASAQMPPPPAPKFAPSAHVPTPLLAEIENSTLASISRASTKASRHHSAAQKRALKKSVESLPQYLFRISTTQAKTSESAKKAALTRPVESYTFILTPPASVRTGKTPSFAMSQIPPYNPSSDAAWTCSLCSLQNPGSAKEKCTICEAPRPPPKSLSLGSGQSSPMFTMPVSSTSFGSQVFNNMKSSSEWTCDTCMLKNPDSAKEKCQVCEARRPAPKSAGTGFAFGSAPAPAKPVTTSTPGGPWTCSLCMLQNPDSAKEKCQICEAKRP